MNPSRLRIPPIVPLALLSLLALFGCSQSVENSTAFREQVSRADSLEQSVKDLSRQLSMLDTEFQQVSRLVAEGKAGAAGVNANAAKALEARVLKLEQAFQDSQKTLTAIQNSLQEMKGVRVAAVAAPAGTAAGEVADEVSTAKIKVKREPGAAPGAPAVAAESSPPKAEVKPEPKREGTYHRVRPGQSIDDIAAEFRTTASAIRNANHLPERAKLIAGQQIFVPKSR